jgi:hypothetical protein
MGDAVDCVETKCVWKSKALAVAMKTSPAKQSNIDIIDIRHDAVETNLREEVLASLRPLSGPKKMPTLLLYDERGLQLFEKARHHHVTIYVML